MTEMAPELICAADLPEYTLDELDDLFAAAETPAPDELSGTARVRVLAAPATKHAPKIIRRATAALLGLSAFPWKGMQFGSTFDAEGATGANIFFSMTSSRRLFRFEIEEGETPFDGAPCLVFNYETQENPPPFRIFREEIRTLNPGLYLCRGNITIKEKQTFLGYFSLEMV